MQDRAEEWQRMGLQCPNCGNQNILWHDQDSHMADFYMCEGCQFDIDLEIPCTWLAWREDGTYFDVFTNAEIVFIDIRTGLKKLHAK